MFWNLITLLISISMQQHYIIISSLTLLILGYFVNRVLIEYRLQA